MWYNVVWSMCESSLTRYVFICIDQAKTYNITYMHICYIYIVMRCVYYMPFIYTLYMSVYYNTHTYSVKLYKYSAEVYILHTMLHTHVHYTPITYTLYKSISYNIHTYICTNTVLRCVHVHPTHYTPITFSVLTP